jgi:DNA primase
MSELAPFYVRRHTYLRERGIPEANLIKHEIGYDPQSTRIVIPVFQMEEHKDDVGYTELRRVLLGWQTRSTKDDGTPKYLTSLGLKIGQVLYNADRFQDPDRWRGLLGTVVVESPLSVVAKSHLDEVGYGFVATFGAPSKSQYRLLDQLYEPLILWFDSDLAGLQDTLKAGEALQAKMNVYVVNNPPKEDVDELDDDTVLELIEESIIPYAEWKEALIHAA